MIKSTASRSTYMLSNPTKLKQRDYSNVLEETEIPNYLDDFSGASSSVHLAPHNYNFYFSPVSDTYAPSDMLGIDGAVYPSVDSIGDYASTATSKKFANSYEYTDETYDDEKDYLGKMNVLEGYRDLHNAPGYKNRETNKYRKEGYVDRADTPSAGRDTGASTYYKREGYVNKKPSTHHVDVNKKSSTHHKKEGYVDTPSTSHFRATAPWAGRATSEDNAYSVSGGEHDMTDQYMQSVIDENDNDGLSYGFNFIENRLDQPTSVGYIGGQEGVYDLKTIGEGGQMNRFDGQKFQVDSDIGSYDVPTGINSGSAYHTL